MANDETAALNRRIPTGPTCECGHTRESHAISGRCLACMKCEVPGHDPHARDGCGCTAYIPARITCPVCGILPGVGGDLCPECEPIVKVGGDPRYPQPQQKGTTP